jgi:hypothetical protein
MFLLGARLAYSMTFDSIYTTLPNRWKKNPLQREVCQSACCRLQKLGKRDFRKTSPTVQVSIEVPPILVLLHRSRFLVPVPQKSHICDRL